MQRSCYIAQGGGGGPVGAPLDRRLRAGGPELGQCRSECQDVQEDPASLGSRQLRLREWQ